MPGTRLHYTVLNPHQKILGQSAKPARKTSYSLSAPPAKAPKLGWLQRLTLPESDKAFIQGCQAWGEGQIKQALGFFESVPAGSFAGADAAWSAALFYTQQEKFEQAATLLEKALQSAHNIGKAFMQHKITPRVQVPVAPHVLATMYPTVQSAHLLLAELQQSQGHSAQALEQIGCQHASGKAVRRY